LLEDEIDGIMEGASSFLQERIMLAVVEAADDDPIIISEPDIECAAATLTRLAIEAILEDEA
ncbi:MAG: hypothetical protein ACXQTE_05175, partial [Methanosarcinaceae archaeon]